MLLQYNRLGKLPMGKEMTIPTVALLFIMFHVHKIKQIIECVFNLKYMKEY